MDGINYLQEELVYLKGLVFKSIDSIIERGDNIEELKEKTEQLEVESIEFKKCGTKVKRGFAWDKYKVPIFIGSLATSSTAAALFFLL